MLQYRRAGRLMQGSSVNHLVNCLLTNFSHQKSSWQNTQVTKRTAAQPATAVHYGDVMRVSLDPPTDPAAYGFTHPIRVRFAETDAMGVVHHANYALYLEEARVAWMRHLGNEYQRVQADGVDLAVIEVWVRHRQPLRFDDVVTVHLMLGRQTRMTFQMGYLLTTNGGACATAVTVHTCVGPDGRPVRPPVWLRDMADAELSSPRTEPTG